MDFTLQKLTPKHKEPLLQLLELYFYDFTVYRNFDVNEQGRYNFINPDAYLEGKDRQAFFIRVEGVIAGFVLVSGIVDKPGEERCLDEFFILKRYRRHGLGKQVALQVFDRFPGDWTLLILENNLRALSFWRKVITTYANGVFEEKHENHAYKQWFSTPQ